MSSWAGRSGKLRSTCPPPRHRLPVCAIDHLEGQFLAFSAPNLWIGFFQSDFNRIAVKTPERHQPGSTDIMYCLPKSTMRTRRFSSASGW